MGQRYKEGLWERVEANEYFRGNRKGKKKGCRRGEKAAFSFGTGKAFGGTGGLRESWIKPRSLGKSYFKRSHK